MACFPGAATNGTTVASFSLVSPTIFAIAADVTAPVDSMISAAWLLAKEAVGDRLLYVLLQMLANACTYYLLNILNDWLLREGDDDTTLFGRYRILPGKKADVDLTKRAKREATIDYAVTPFALYFAFWYFETYMNPRMMSDEVPQLLTLALHLVACMFLEDTILYWGHRAEHHPKIYAATHKLHHEFHVSTGWAANFTTACEKNTVFLWSVLVPPLLLRSHFIVKAVHMWIVVVDSFFGHFGYDLPYVPFSSALRHNYHHSHNVGTYGLKFGFWDAVCGTDKSFKRWKAKYYSEREQRWARLDAKRDAAWRQRIGGSASAATAPQAASAMS